MTTSPLCLCSGAGTCAICRIAARDPRVARLVGNPPRPAVGVPLNRPAACRHLGGPTGAEVECPSCAGTVHLRVFGCAVHGSCTAGKRVEGVACCKGCPDYVSAGAPSLRVPAPSSLPLSPSLRLASAGDAVATLPRSDRAVVTFSAGSIGQDLLCISGRAMADYAARVGADFIVHPGDGGVPSYPVAGKFAIGEYLKRYRRLIVADADVLFPPDAPDLFAEVPPSRLGAFDEVPAMLRDPDRGLGYFREYRDYRRRWGMKLVPFGQSMNVGLMVVPDTLRTVFTPPSTLPAPPAWCAEQHWWNARLHNVGVGFVRLNHVSSVWCVDRRFTEADRGKILHFAGTSDHNARLVLMGQWARCHRPG